ncbi:related to salicylate hydroxylase [Cephalotrichum gorgonifer]|uniref:Related to salicylate hydroxylase n=1 Tax=Cephalotrichum gorgonifer TaxID=2041049 RepID=A0AAE8MQH7_9PEZI|nr:related to salicylate hydroxylase [Cephalotrichum gorgonifer]
MADTNGVELSSPTCFVGERDLHVDAARPSDVRDLNIAIIGAGMGGLGCALSLAKKGFKNINVYETASGLGFVGAGIQMAPNMVRILDRLGCWESIEKTATVVSGSSIRQGSTNEELARVPMPNIKELYGYPHTADHRSLLSDGMYQGCRKESAIKFHFATAMTEITSLEGQPTFRVQPRGSEPYTVKADLLLACDGIKSETRNAILKAAGAEGVEAETGQAAYRIMLKREDMEHDPEMKALIDSDEVVRWIGEKRHIIAYSVSDHSIYNLSTTQPDKNFAAAPSATYTTRGDKSVMMDVFGDFCPLVHRMLDLVPEGEVCEWRLRMHEALPTWTHGRAALLGDACHPTLPHLSQGSAMAIEDGAVVAEVLALAPDTKPETLARCLKVYELARKEWCTRLVELAAFSGRTLHLGEGKAKEERDRQFAEAKARGEGVVPDKWASPEVQKMIFSNDCVENIRRDFDELYKSLEGEVGVAA